MNEQNEEAFSVKIMCEDKSIKKIAKENKLDKIFVNWKRSRLEIGRLMFSKFPPEIYSVISKQHCVITAKKELRVKKRSVSPSPETKNNLIGPTLNIEQLDQRVNKRQKPNIKVNGELVLNYNSNESKSNKKHEESKVSSGNFLTV